MTTGDGTKRLGTLLKGLSTQFPEASPGPCPAAAWPCDPLIRELVFGILLAEATTSQAVAATMQLDTHFVDYNDMRVALPGDVARVLSDTVPLGAEKAARIRACLNDVQRREHCLSLTPLSDSGRRDARAYVASLEGVPAFAASRLLALHFGVHAVPVDERLRTLLVREQAIPSDMAASEVAALLEKMVKPGLAVATLALLQAWSDSAAPEIGRREPYGNAEARQSLATGAEPGAQASETPASPPSVSKGADPGSPNGSQRAGRSKDGERPASTKKAKASGRRTSEDASRVGPTAEPQAGDEGRASEPGSTGAATTYDEPRQTKKRAPRTGDSGRTRGARNSGNSADRG
ncbi:MAG: hypothetical protein SFZ23_01795 [Planctomycetota bacterium]|nr:hypothetical protein [Planctomycetota bacterium]